MRCLACNKVLNDFEATRKYHESKQYIDLCNHCFYSGVHEEVCYEERTELAEVEDLGDEYEEIKFEI